MKIQKINDKVHSDLKNHLKDTSIFMQSYVEHLINTAIKNKIKYVMRDEIEKLSDFIHTEELDYKKGKIGYLQHVVSNKKNPHILRIFPDSKIEDYFKILLKDNDVDNKSLNGLYFNIPGYTNVKNPKIKPVNLQGVIQYVSGSKVDDSLTFIMLGDISESVEDLLNMPSDGDFQISFKCKLERIKSLKADTESQLLGNISLFVKEKKVDLEKGEHLSLIDLKKSLVSNIISNAKDVVDSICHTKEDNDDILKSIITASNKITTDSLMGVGNKCVIPFWLSDSMTKTLGFDNINLTDSCILDKIGSYMGIDFYTSSLVENVYVYRTCKNTLKFLYNFDKCDVNDVNFDFFNIDSNKVYNFSVLKETEIGDINEELLKNIKEFPFIDIDNTYSALNLNFNYLNIATNKSNMSLKYFNVIKEMIHTIKNSILNTESFKSIDLKIYGNESKNEIELIIKEYLNKYSRFDNSPLIVNGLVGGFLLESKDFKRLKQLEVKVKNATLNCIGHYNEHPVYIDSYMKYNDLTINILNDIQLKYNKNFIISAYKNSKNLVYNFAFKIIKDIAVINIIDDNKKLY